MSVICGGPNRHSARREFSSAHAADNGLLGSDAPLFRHAAAIFHVIVQEAYGVTINKKGSTVSSSIPDEGDDDVKRPLPTEPMSAAVFSVWH